VQVDDVLMAKTIQTVPHVTSEVAPADR
jgi:hypothetical protein